LTLIGAIIKLVATYIFTAMVVQLVADVQDGKRDSSPTQLLQAAVPVLGSLIFVSIVAGVAIGVGFLLLLVPGLILLTLWAVFVPVIVLERPPGLGSLGRSRELVRGHAWSVFGIYVLLFLLIGVVSGLAAVIAFAASTAVGIVVSVVIAVLTVPLEAVAAAVIYFELLKLSKGPTPAFADVPGSSPVAPAPVPPATGASDAEKAFGSEDA